MVRSKRHVLGGISMVGEPARSKPPEIFDACLPERALFPLVPSKGVYPLLAVRLGDMVDEGSLLASGPLGTVRVHSSIPGRVASVRKLRLADNIECEAVEVELAGAFPFHGKQKADDWWINASAEHLLDRVRACGLITGPKREGCLASYCEEHMHSDNIILNFLETQPHNRTAATLLVHKSADVFEGLRALARIFGNAKVHVVLPHWLEHYAELFLEKLRSWEFDSTVHFVPDRLGAELPSILIPILHLEVGSKPCILDALSVYHLYEALAFNKPQIECLVNLSGFACKRSGVIRVRTGTPLYQVLEDGGGLDSIPESLILNDVMQGYRTANIDLPVDKGLHSLIGLTHAEIRHAKQNDCISCGECVRHCPVGLEPSRLHKLIRKDMREQALQMGLEDCTECGLCSYVCPARIPLTQTFRIERHAGLSSRGVGS